MSTGAFLRWAGGKRWLADLVDLSGQVSDGDYYEPFVGSGAMYFGALPKRAVLSDSNAELITTYKIVRDQADALIAELAELTNDSETYYHLRDGEAPHDDLQIAIRFIYLNRTSYGGIHRVNKSGRFNVPYGKSPERLVLQESALLKASQKLANAELVIRDYGAALRELTSGDFVYLDPPYRNTFNRYTSNCFQDEDTDGLIQSAIELASTGVLVMMSLPSDASLIPKLNGLRVYRVVGQESLRRSERRTLRSELVATSFDLKARDGAEVFERIDPEGAE